MYSIVSYFIWLDYYPRRSTSMNRIFFSFFFQISVLRWISLLFSFSFWKNSSYLTNQSQQDKRETRNEIKRKGEKKENYLPITHLLCDAISCSYDIQLTLSPSFPPSPKKSKKSKKNPISSLSLISFLYYIFWFLGGRERKKKKKKRERKKDRSCCW